MTKRDAGYLDQVRLEIHNHRNRIMGNVARAGDAMGRHRNRFAAAAKVLLRSSAFGYVIADDGRESGQPAGA